MKLLTPEISWHETTPIYSCDIQQAPNYDANGDAWYRLATGGRDNRVQLWRLLPASIGGGGGGKEGAKGVELLSSLRRHEKPVNVVRFSPDSRLLASGSDDATVLLWTRQESASASASTAIADEDDIVCQEVWTVWRALRGHLEDVYDLGWMPDSMGLVSGSVDRSIVRWNLSREHQRTIVREHAHFVQGIACDPLGRLLATQSSDRTVRIYGASARPTVLARCARTNDAQSAAAAAAADGTQPQQPPSSHYRLFADDSWKSFFRRLAFSPDGKLLAAPAGLHWNDNFCVHLFARARLDRPAASLVTGQAPPVAVRFCQRRFALAYHPQLELGRRRIGQDLVKLPYRWVFAVVLESGVLLCDTQHPFPIGALRNLHYQALNDAAWTPDGSQLVLASTDGYCSIVRFAEGELGQAYEPAAESSIESKENRGVDSAATSAAAVTPKCVPPPTQQPPPPTPPPPTPPPSAAATVVAGTPGTPTATTTTTNDPLTPRGQKRRVPFVTIATSLEASAESPQPPQPPPPSSAQEPPSAAAAAAAAPPAAAAAATAATAATTTATSSEQQSLQSPLRKKRRVSFLTLSNCIGDD